MKLEQIKTGAELCAIAYEKDDSTATKLAEDAGFRDIVHVGNGGTHAVVARHGDTTYCMIRGTEWEDIYDVERNFRILPVPAYVGLPTNSTRWQKFCNFLLNGWVQAGFRSGARQQQEALGDLLDERGEVVIGGHSQGAAVALILAAFVGQLRKEKGLRPPNVLGIATPPPGSWIFNRKLASLTASIVCVTNSSDPVCWVPFWFRYPKNERIHFTTFGEPLRNPGWIKWLKDQPAGIWKFTCGVLLEMCKGRSMGKSIMARSLGRTSHAMTTYLRLIRKIEK